jgi:RHH-type proline utilization regulon transcriptional repressor/proline dehydrogenase/delta 1-pyrroline-5-carboxylate dehydrogenase
MFKNPQQLTPLALNAHYLDDEHQTVEKLLAVLDTAGPEPEKTRQLATALVQKVRDQMDQMDGIDAFMKEYDLSSKEGIVLMCLAEALLRIPDKETAEKLIKDKLLEADWESHLGKSQSLFVNASTWGLMLTGKIIDVAADSTGFQRVLEKLVNRAGEPVVRMGIYQAMKIMGKQFVMGRTIEEALKRAGKKDFRDYRYSFDMLGEAALTQADADRYFAAYQQAIEAIASFNQKRSMEDAASISIKLSALHPRYESTQADRVIAELAPRVLQLAQLARDRNVAVTIDAEEADRLEISLLVFQKVYAQLDDYTGFGLVVQAYQKRGLPVIEWLAQLARTHGRKIPVRLVKGAYWDTEIKRSQEQGLDDYPVFTRKVNTDVSYLACASRLLQQRDLFYPQFATHNANTIAAVKTMAGEEGGFEFQRLHGMGQALHKQVISPDGLNTPSRIYAPVGSHEDLLPYLVRRLLENGANTSFVNRLTDLELSLDEITQDPIATARSHANHRHPRIPLPVDIFGPERKNSRGVNLGSLQAIAALDDEIHAHDNTPFVARPLVPGADTDNLKQRDITCPADRDKVVGLCSDGDKTVVEKALQNARAAFPAWRDTPVAKRAEILRTVADLLEQNRGKLMYLAQQEAGKNVPDCIAEVREAVDFCRYYAQQAEEHLACGQKMPGPTGESNYLYNQGRGVFVCISPWNFPLAIYTGQIAAALVAGNTVIAKPAEQTPLIATETARLFHAAGVPEEVLQVIPGDGAQVGAPLTASPVIAGVAFTGSTETAQIINKTLAGRNGPIAQFIAETGGQNCFIADSSALPEQLVKDIISSAFTSAGQRCSAARVLYIQEDIADKVLTMLAGAMAELRNDHPQYVSTDVGPLIDEDARTTLENHAKRMQAEARIVQKLDNPPLNGTFFPPHVAEIPSVTLLQREVFGPFLHVVRFKADELDKVIDEINATGYGLTFGIHSRIDETIEHVISRIQAGNCYINRNTIGAVVGVQPFGGMGLSGTGPKAGGPQYLHAFSTEKTVTNNIAAVGGNAELLELSEDE